MSTSPKQIHMSRLTNMFRHGICIFGRFGKILGLKLSQIYLHLMVGFPRILDTYTFAPMIERSRSRVTGRTRVCHKKVNPSETSYLNRPKDTVAKSTVTNPLDTKEPPTNSNSPPEGLKCLSDSRSV